MAAGLPGIGDAGYSASQEGGLPRELARRRPRGSPPDEIHRTGVPCLQRLKNLYRPMFSASNGRRTRAPSRQGRQALWGTAISSVTSPYKVSKAPRPAEELSVDTRTVRVMGGEGKAPYRTTIPTCVRKKRQRRELLQENLRMPCPPSTAFA